MLFACFPSNEIYLLSFFFFCMLSKDVVCMLSQNKKIFLPMKYIENINKNIFNNFLIATPAPYFFKNCRVSHLHLHLHPSLETLLCFIGPTSPREAHGNVLIRSDLPSICGGFFPNLVRITKTYHG